MSFVPPPSPEDPLGSTPPGPPPGAPLASHPMTEGTGLPRNIAATLACIFLLVGGVAFYILDRRDVYVRFYALQAIVLSVVFLVVDLAFTVCLFIVHSIPLVGWFFGKAYLVSNLGLCVLWVLLILNAYQGKMFEMPVLWRVAKRYIPQTLQ